VATAFGFLSAEIVQGVSSLLIEYLNESNYHIALCGAIGDFCLRQNLFK
jgi:hypothetical protein